MGLLPLKSVALVVGLMLGLPSVVFFLELCYNFFLLESRTNIFFKLEGVPNFFFFFLRVNK